MTCEFSSLQRNHYSTILCDPPWSFKSWSDKGKNRAPDAMVRQKGLAERHYKTMSLADIKALPVGDIAARDSVLIMWILDCMIPDALELGKAWGFTFKTTGLTWHKTRANGAEHIGLGYWGRGQTEQSFLFTRGSAPADLPAWQAERFASVGRPARLEQAGALDREIDEAIKKMRGMAEARRA